MSVIRIGIMGCHSGKGWMENHWSSPVGSVPIFVFPEVCTPTIEDLFIDKTEFLKGRSKIFKIN